jgi:hypothetical protein
MPTPAELRPPTQRGDQNLATARRLAKLLDTAVGVPGTKLRFGLDALLGLVPGAGDAIGAALSGYIILAAARAGASRAMLLRMVGTVALDTLVGSVPVLGDLFDVAFRSNQRNVALLERFAAEPAAVRTVTRRLGNALVVGGVLFLIALVAVGVLLASAIWRLLAGS